MAENIKYIRWAAGVLKIVMIIRVVLGIITFLSTFLIPIAAASQGNNLAAGVSVAINFGALITIVIDAFIIYTAARALELLADIAYHLLATWHSGNKS